MQANTVVENLKSHFSVAHGSDVLIFTVGGWDFGPVIPMSFSKVEQDICESAVQIPNSTLHINTNTRMFLL